MTRRGRAKPELPPTAPPLPDDWRRVAIVLIRPAGFDHTRAFTEVIDALSEGFRALGAQLEYRENGFVPDAVNILLCGHFLTDEGVDAVPPRTVVYNFEQLEASSVVSPTYLTLLGRHPVWDYSPRNIEHLRKRLGHARVYHVPVGYVPGLSRIGVAEPQDIDVLFYGSVNERRRQVLDRLSARGLKVEVAFGVYGAARDALIARAKVVVNIHYYPSRISEAVRLSYLMANGKAVVTECEADTELDDDLRSGVLAVPYEGIVDACAALVGDPERRADLEKRALAGIQRLSEPHILSSVAREVQFVTVPARINLGSGKNWRQDCLNIDINDVWSPDLVVDASVGDLFERQFDTERFGSLRLTEGMASEIICEDVLEHVPDLVLFMGNGLRLLREGGVFRILVPYDLSYGAWQDPTHIRAFNERSWLYYTDWFWYVGWTEHRFDLVSQEAVFSPIGTALQAGGTPLEDIMRQPRAVDSLRVVLRKRPLTPEEKEIAKRYRRGGRPAI